MKTSKHIPTDDYTGPLVAVAYYRPPSPPVEEWENDFKQISKMGFRAVKMWLYWGWHERKKGEFDWHESDLFFDLAEKNNLSVIPQVLLELPPSWQEIRHVLQTPDGPVRKAHFPAIHIPCFDDQELRRAAEPFVEILVQRYQKRDILHWDVWNEPRSKWTCVCQASLESYKQWLKKKYKTVHNYNKIFGKCFHGWDAVVVCITGGGDYADEYNWRLWAADSIADQVHWVGRIVKNIDSHHPIMAHVGSCSPIQNVRKDTCVDAIVTKSLDFYGCSYDASWESQAYVTDASNVRGLENQSPLTRAKIQVDWLRSLSPKNWICELYPNIYNAWETRKPEMLMWQFWQAACRGLGGIILWEYKVERIGVESLGYGLLGLDGKPNDRSEALCNAIRLIKGELADFFKEFFFAEPSVGILYDERSYLLSELEGYYGDKFAGIQRKSFLALYETLRRRNIPVRLVPHQHLDTVLPSLKTLFLPGHGYMDAALAEKMADFVGQGGHLIGQAGVGFRRENTWVSTVIPSYGLDALFGVREISRSLVEGKLDLLDRNRQVVERLSSFRVELECAGAKPEAWFSDEAVALASNRVGKGRTYYLGGFLGMDEPEAGRLLYRIGVDYEPDDVLAKLADLRLDVIPWQYRGARSGKPDAYFIFNTSEKMKELELPKTRSGSITSLFGNAFDRKRKLRLGANSAVLLW